MKHTQGEWEIGDITKPTFDDYYNCKSSGVIQIDPICCDLWYSPIHPISHINQAIANAKLICAAPDLLEACMNLENDDNSIPEHAWKLIQDAIKKATS